MGREATSHNSGMVLTLALNYSARTELVDAFRSMVQAAAQNGGIEHCMLMRTWWPGICIRGTCRTRIW